MNNELKDLVASIEIARSELNLRLNHLEGNHNNGTIREESEIRTVLDRFEYYDAYNRISDNLNSLANKNTDEFTKNLIKNALDEDIATYAPFINFETLAKSYSSEAEIFNAVRGMINSKKVEVTENLYKDLNNSKVLERTIQNNKYDINLEEEDVITFESEEDKINRLNIVGIKDLEEDTDKINQFNINDSDIVESNDKDFNENEDLIKDGEWKKVVTDKDEYDEMIKAEDKNAKIRGRIFVTALGVAGLLALLHACNASLGKEHNSDANVKASIIEELNEEKVKPELTNAEKLQALVNKGYSEHAASLMLLNFSTDTINKLLSDEVPFIKAVEFYATEKEFNLDYINDYEDARIKFNIIASEIVDYVNRAHLIDETGYYAEEEIIQIVDVLKAINDKTIISNDNVNLVHSFHTTNNRIVEAYFNNEITEEDINKLNALQYFAKEGTDLDKFLTNLAPLTQDILRNPHASTPKNELYKYFNIFGRSENGFTNEPSALTDNKEFNENAMLNGYFEYYFASQAFVEPYMPFVYPKELQKIDLIELEKIYYMFSYKQYGEEVMNKRMEEVLKHSEYVELREQILQYFKIHDLEDAIDTALLGPEFTELCQNGGRYKDIIKEEVKTNTSTTTTKSTNSSKSKSKSSSKSTSTSKSSSTTTTSGSATRTSGSTTTTTTGASSTTVTEQRGDITYNWNTSGNSEYTVTQGAGSESTTWNESECKESTVTQGAGSETTIWNDNGSKEKTETTNAGSETIIWNESSNSTSEVVVPAGDITIVWDEVTEEVNETIDNTQKVKPPKPGENWYWDESLWQWIEFQPAGEEVIVWDDETSLSLTRKVRG